MTRYVGLLPYIGAAVIIFAAFTVWREYAAFLERGVCWCRAFLAALCDLREKMKCYLDSPRSWAEGYEDGLLYECGFLERLRDGENLHEAYRASRRGACLSDTADEILDSCFRRLGEGYLDTELESVELAIEKLSGEEARGSEELVRRRKVAGAVLGACASGIVILVI